MPDLTPLPPLRQAPPFAPDPERFARVTHVARRRRAVRTAVPAGVVAAVAIAVLASTAASAPNGLDVVAPATASPRPTPWVSVSAGPDGVHLDAGTGPSPTASPSESPSYGSTSPAPDEPAPTATATADPASPAPAVRSSATLTHVPYDTATACQADSSDKVNGWCMRARPPSSAHGGVPVDLVFEVCRPDSAGTLRYADSSEMWFEVDRDQNEVVTVDATSAPGAGAHTIDVAAATCARWTVRWVVADRNGHPLAAGTYTVFWDDLGRLDYHQGVIVSGPGRGTFDLTVG